MTDTANLTWAPQPMKITVIDNGQQLEVADVQRWIDERKQLLQLARDILGEYDGKPPSLYKHHAALVTTVGRLAQLNVIFDEFNRQRMQHADANIDAMVRYFSDPKTMEGVND